MTGKELVLKAKLISARLYELEPNMHEDDFREVFKAFMDILEYTDSLEQQLKEVTEVTLFGEDEHAEDWF